MIAATLLVLAVPAGDCAVVDPTLRDFAGNLPIVIVDSCGASLAKEHDVQGQLLLFVPVNDGMPLRGEPAWRGPVMIHHRGASSLHFPKKQLAVALAAPVDLLGLPAAARFVLNAPYSDKTLLRNVLAYDWARRIGLLAPDVRLVELFLNLGGDAVTRADYHGVYLLTERPESLVGDAALFRRDKVDPGDQVFKSAAGETYIVDLPHGASGEQIAGLREQVNRFETALRNKQPPAPKGSTADLAALADLRSFADDALLVELTKNADGFKWSTYFHLGANGLIKAGPAWDYDASLRNDPVAVDPTGWQHRFARPDRSPYWPLLYGRADFTQLVADRYAELRRDVLSNEALFKQLEMLPATFTAARQRNFQRWPVLGKSLPSNPDAPATYEDELANLTNWLELRLAWLDEQMVPTPQVAGDVVTAVDGEVFFDSGDPREAGGSNKATARLAELIKPAQQTTLADHAREKTTCGTASRFSVNAEPGLDAIWLDTTSPAELGFEVRLNGQTVARKRPLPINIPQRDLGSAVDGEGRLHLQYRLPAPTETTLAFEVASPGCQTPAVSIIGVRAGRWRLPAGAWVLRARGKNGWSAPVRRPL